MPPETQVGQLDEREDEVEDQGYGQSHADNRNLPKELQSALWHMIQTARDRQRYARINEVQDAWLQQLFDRGQIDVAWDEDGGYYVTPNGVSSGGGGDSGNREPVAGGDNYNLYLGFRKSYNATFCQAGANVTFEPLQAGNPGDDRAAETANKMRRVIEKLNDTKALQAKVGRYLFTDARVAFYTRWEQDGGRFGGAKGPREVIDAYGVLQFVCPIASSGQNEWPYCGFEYELDKTIEQDEYPWAAGKIKTTAATNDADQVARLARLSVAEGLNDQSQGVEASAWMVTRSNWFFRPCFYRECSLEIRKQLEDLFPDGVRTVFVGQEYCCAVAESMDDHVVVVHALPGAGQKRASIGSPMVSVQRAFDSGMNIAHDTFKHGIPKEIGDQEIVDFAARQNQSSVPGDMIPGKKNFNLKAGDSFDNHFHAEAMSVVNPALPEWLNNLQGPLSQFLTGQLAPVYGGDDKNNETAKGRQMAANLALGLMGLTWQPYTVGYANVMLQAVKCAAKNRKKPIQMMLDAVGRRGGRKTLLDIDPEDLEGQLAAYPATDENYPRSPYERKNAYLSVLELAKQNPALGAVLSTPDNMALGKDLLGLEDLEIPEAEAGEKQLDEIEEMLEDGAPAIDVEATQKRDQALAAQGQQIPPQPILKPSVPIGHFDNNEAELAKGKRWLNDPQQGQKIKRTKDGKLQIMNVEMHLQLHEQAIAEAAKNAAATQAAQLAASKATPPKAPTESFTVAYKDLPPEVQRQLLQQAGFQVTVMPQQAAPVQ